MIAVLATAGAVSAAVLTAKCLILISQFHHFFSGTRPAPPSFPGTLNVAWVVCQILAFATGVGLLITSIGLHERAVLFRILGIGLLAFGIVGLQWLAQGASDHAVPSPSGALRLESYEAFAALALFASAAFIAASRRRLLDPVILND
jgi:hypothetical protein